MHGAEVVYYHIGQAEIGCTVKAIQPVQCTVVLILCVIQTVVSLW